MEEVILHSAFVRSHVSGKSFEEIREADSAIALVEEQQAVIAAPDAVNHLYLVVVAKKGFVAQSEHFFLPLQRGRHPEGVEVLHPFFTRPAADPVGAKTPEVVHVDDAGGVVQGFGLVALQHLYSHWRVLICPRERASWKGWYVVISYLREKFRFPPRPARSRPAG